MNKTQRKEITKIRDMVARIYEHTALVETHQKVYEMFGSLTDDMAKGIVIGLNMALREL